MHDNEYAPCLPRSSEFIGRTRRLKQSGGHPCLPSSRSDAISNLLLLLLVLLFIGCCSATASNATTMLTLYEYWLLQYYPTIVSKLLYYYTTIGIYYFCLFNSSYKPLMASLPQPVLFYCTVTVYQVLSILRNAPVCQTVFAELSYASYLVCKIRVRRCLVLPCAVLAGFHLCKEGV